MTLEKVTQATGHLAMELNTGNVKFKFVESDFFRFRLYSQFSLMSLTHKSALLFGGTLLLLGGTFGCGNLAQSVPVTNIRDIQQNRSNYSTIYLKGRVENQAPFLGTGAYQVRDETGSIWVFTTQNLPNKGEEILLKGEVQYKNIPLAGQDLGEVYIEELEQIKRQQSEKNR